MMTSDELREGITAIEKECKAKINSLYRQYAKENNPYKVGDILQDDMNKIIQVESMQLALSFNGIPYYIFTGMELTKKLTPKRGNRKESMVQMRVVKKLN